ncbi:prostaglandin reductase 1-like [Achroia grisella]|uniref:prostaglandin reductase 1-like n=1 Tax=Achroia grisella TaxID=688607 RepID=UPI0027D2963E|nr:prostaglandin reductase 1-like [Achroia grisella]XP_059048577.1 prostaglandin reductase 1-like [Achroia grisella]
MVKAKKYVVKQYFEGLPKPEDYDIVEEVLEPIKAGGIVVKTEWISVDPYLRAYNRRSSVPYDQYSFQVGVVQESKNPDFPIGTRVVTHKGWRNYTVIYPKEASPEDTIYKLPDLRGLSNSLGVGAVGMPGATAYFGFLEICKPKPGETVVVTGAAGAVGSIVGQIAKIKGCKVIGFAGSDDKVQWLEKELGFDKAINYKTADVAKVLKEAAPNGVDCFFDNVGGDLSSAIIYQMNLYGRVSVCGSISAYNEDVHTSPKANILQPAIVAKQLKIEGFIVHRWRNQWPKAFSDIVQWIESGKLIAREHVTEGFDNILKAFVGMLNGENTGKAVVKV